MVIELLSCLSLGCLLVDFIAQCRQKELGFYCYDIKTKTKISGDNIKVIRIVRKNKALFTAPINN